MCEFQYKPSPVQEQLSVLYFWRIRNVEKAENLLETTRGYATCCDMYFSNTRDFTISKWHQSFSEPSGNRLGQNPAEQSANKESCKVESIRESILYILPQSKWPETKLGWILARLSQSRQSKSLWLGSCRLYCIFLSNTTTSKIVNSTS